MESMTREEELLTLRQAGERIGMTDRALATAIRRGQLVARTIHEPRPGRPGYYVTPKDLEAFQRSRGMQELPEVPEHLRNVVVPMSLAAQLVRRAPQVLQTAAREGRLRAGEIQAGGKRYWQVRLQDLAEWLARPGRGPRRMRPRTFDREIMAQIARMFPGDGDQAA